MSDFWPDDLVQALSQRRGVIFLGAGASASCVSNSGSRQPNWTALLKKLARGLAGKDRIAFDEAMSRSRLLDAAQIVVDNVAPPTLHSRLIEIFLDNTIRPSSLYESVNLIDQSVVMTTNYDRMYERFWEIDLNEPLSGSKSPLMVSYYKESDVVDNLRSDRRMLLKLHGTIEKPRDIVLSRSQYSLAKYEHANFFRVVSALMLTRTMLFVGCGFNGDPDIDLLLEDSAFTAQSTAPHYALVAKGRHSSEIRSLKNAFNITLLEYDNDNGDHAEMLAQMASLAQLVEANRV
ncbi:SIR2-like domain-containing protein [Plantibacter sp. VKM Ac-1784]|uniref:SIR2-like domain-containing protein n=1 Tax=Plantibacter elymi (nom. nud.) TaxID=199708 RepID=A0ABY1R9K3_9MICO|nr:SIR2 family protein [Plantibacter sp. VKM Ac-1784]SMQ58101.1 SIR2-like domain-containing protein [Plantibacter sp. VKM Ac-1784]